MEQLVGRQVGIMKKPERRLACRKRTGGLQLKVVFGVALSARDREFGDTVFVGSFCVREHGERLPSVCLGQPEVESEGPAVRGRPLARPAPP